MNLFSPAQVVGLYAEAGRKKCGLPAGRLLMLGILAGILIAMGSAVTATATHTLAGTSLVRLVSGLLFPFGLGMVVLSGGELFTGNCLICISIYEKKATVSGMLRNWGLVYLANFTGALLVAVGCAWFGQLDLSGGQLAVATIRGAVAKCALPFANAMVMGMLCNMLVALGVLLSMTAKDTTGKIMGAFLPVSFFVICGFEHCVANMYSIPAGLFALSVPRYASLATEAGIDLSALSWSGFFLRNLLPVTIGNTLGGILTGTLLWLGHRETAKEITAA